jgi:hypothetical protein
MQRKMLALAVAGLVAVGVAACGDDGGDDTSSETGTTAAAISEEDFVAQANEICAEGNAELDEGPEDGDFEGFITDALIPNIQAQVDAIEALGAPEGQEEQVAQFLEDAQTQLDALEEDPSAIGDETFADVNEQAMALGLDECAT